MTLKMNWRTTEKVKHVHQTIHSDISAFVTAVLLNPGPWRTLSRLFSVLLCSNTPACDGCHHQVLQSLRMTGIRWAQAQQHGNHAGQCSLKTRMENIQEQTDDRNPAAVFQNKSTSCFALNRRIFLQSFQDCSVHTNSWAHLFAGFAVAPSWSRFSIFSLWGKAWMTKRVPVKMSLLKNGSSAANSFHMKRVSPRPRTLTELKTQTLLGIHPTKDRSHQNQHLWH